MQFDFIPWETDVGKEYLPMLPVQLNGFSVGHALVDTGATVSIFPMSLCDLLGIQLDKGKKIMMSHAGGGSFPVFPSAAKVHYCIDHSGFRPIQWKGTVFFSHDPTLFSWDTFNAWIN